jgi:Flp pilus assembly protein TadG
MVCRGNLIATRLTASRRGASIVEFALLLPVLAGFLYGIMAYGQYFLLAHSVQELANDAARATIGGLTADERRTIATASVAAELPKLGTMSADRVTTQVDEASGLVTVRVRLDASNVGLFRTPLVPMPDSMIERRAVIRAGGIS